MLAVEQQTHPDNEVTVNSVDRSAVSTPHIPFASPKVRVLKCSSQSLRKQIQILYLHKPCVLKSKLITFSLQTPINLSPSISHHHFHINSKNHNFFFWWAGQDSNLQPDRYERPALTIELPAPPGPDPGLRLFRPNSAPLATRPGGEPCCAAQNAYL